MSQNEVPALVDFGFTVLQARVYIALLRLGTATATNVSSAIGVYRSEAYRILRELSSKKLVQRHLTSPSTFTAIPPHDCLSLLIQQSKKKLAELETQRDNLDYLLSSITPTTVDLTHHRLDIIEANSTEKFKQMMKEARYDHVGVVAKYGFGKMLSDGSAQAIVSAAKRKVRVRLIAEVDRPNIKTARLLSRYCEIRQSRGILLYVDIVDKKQMLFGPGLVPSDQDSRVEAELDLWTTIPRFVQAMYAMFENLWAISPKYVADKH
jgi:HTH-type transcriptional regulator, sugar sensing transcriptional regulator